MHPRPVLLFMEHYNITCLQHLIEDQIRRDAMWCSVNTIRCCFYIILTVKSIRVDLGKKKLKKKRNKPMIWKTCLLKCKAIFLRNNAVDGNQHFCRCQSWTCMSWSLQLIGYETFRNLFFIFVESRMIIISKDFVSHDTYL